MLYMRLPVSFIPLMHFRPIPACGNENSHLVQYFVHSWPLKILAFGHMAQKKLAAMAAGCKVEPFQRFSNCFRPAVPANWSVCHRLVPRTADSYVNLNTRPTTSGLVTVSV